MALQKYASMAINVIIYQQEKNPDSKFSPALAV